MTMAKRAMLGLLAAGALASGTGCAYVTSSGPSSTAVTGEAWYTEAHRLLRPFLGEQDLLLPGTDRGGSGHV